MRYYFNRQLVCSVLSMLVIYSVTAQQQYEWRTETHNGYTYKYVTNDPTHTRIYTLKNGLTVMLSENHKEPRIVYRMAVRAGSNNDPKDHTGLAHYLEHLLFKGTDQYGTLNWVKEKPYIDTIYGLYEKYNTTTDSLARRNIYKEIDRISGIAAHYAISGEYSKLMENIGSQKTNAHTSVEETVFEEDIPSNQSDKFLMVQAERFRNPVFRLFHTELEAVYEEKNRALDNDARKILEIKNALVFPTHNYGQQTTIGTVEHLKNPSLVAIRNFYQQYYVPNNMGLALVGDFNADSMIRKVEKYFSYMQSKPVAAYQPVPEQALNVPVEKTVFNNTEVGVQIAYRTPAANTREALVLSVVSKVLYNSKAGMIDINLNKQQKVQNAAGGMVQFKDYGVFSLSASPKQGQTLEEVRDTLLHQLQLLKSGYFDDALISAIYANNKLSFYTAIEGSTSRAVGMVNAFIKNRMEKWDWEIAELDAMKTITKKEITTIANQYLGDGYVVLYLRKGEDKNIVKVQKPPITPVETNADKQSLFLKNIMGMPVKPIAAQWLDFSKDFQKSKAGISDVYYVQNKEDGRFRLHYRFEMGARSNNLLPIAAEYLQYLGTDQLTNEQISKTFYNLACTFSLNVIPEGCAVNLSGLEENFEKAVDLLENLIANCQPDERVLAGLKARYMKQRAAAKTNKSNIMQGMAAFAKYGSNNPFNSVLSNDDIQEIHSVELINILQTIFQHKHEIIFYGAKPLEQFTGFITAKHSLPVSFVSYPPQKKYNPVSQTANQVLFTNFDMVQTELNWVINEGPYDGSKEAIIKIFNNYFGAGGTSLVFQTIRDSKALAYSTSAMYQIPGKKEDFFSFGAYAGCQSDKMEETISTMNELLTKMPVNEKGFEQAKQKRKSDIETERAVGVDIIFAYLNARAKGSNMDTRKQEYQSIDALTMKNMVEFHKENLSGKPYTLCVLGDEKKVNREELGKFGNIQILSLKELFGY